jgi:lysophospholipase L1-like esterase
MKRSKGILLAIGSVICIAGHAISQTAFPVWPMPSPLPTYPPKSVNRAVVPAPRVDWLEKVQTNILKGQQSAKSIQLVFDGDSITDFWQAAGKEVWAQRYSQCGAIDFGISGDLTQHLLWRLSQGQVEGIHPKLIAIMIGTNNMPYSVDQIAEGVKAVVAEYRKRCPEATILLQAIFPRGEKPTDANRIKVKAVNDIICKLGDGDKVIYTDFSDRFLSADGTISRENMPDFLHPSAKGYEIWADAIQPYIDKYVLQK